MYLKSSQYFIQSLNKLATLLISMLITTGSSKISIPRVFRANNNKVVDSGGGADKMVKKICLSSINALFRL